MSNIKKLLAFILLLFLISITISLILGKKKIYQNAIIKIGYEIYKIKPQEVADTLIGNTMAKAMIAVDRNLLTIDKVKTIDSLLKVMINNKKIDSLSFVNYIKTIDSILDTSVIKGGNL